MLVLFYLVLLLLCFPLGKLPLSFLTLKKRLYLREQDTGQGLHLVAGYPGASLGICSAALVLSMMVLERILPNLSA